MALCHNTRSYERKQQRNKLGYATAAATKERRALKKAARKFERACKQIIIEEQLQESFEETSVLQRAKTLVDTAIETRWELDTLIEMWELHESIPPRVKFLAQSSYEAWMLSEE